MIDRLHASVVLSSGEKEKAQPLLAPVVVVFFVPGPGRLAKVPQPL